MQHLGHTYTKNFFIIYLKFKFNWASYILSGKPTSSTIKLRISDDTFPLEDWMCIIILLLTGPEGWRDGLGGIIFKGIGMTSSSLSQLGSPVGPPKSPLREPGTALWTEAELPRMIWNRACSLAAHVPVSVSSALLTT